MPERSRRQQFREIPILKKVWGFFAYFYTKIQPYTNDFHF